MLILGDVIAPMKLNTICTLLNRIEIVSIKMKMTNMPHIAAIDDYIKSCTYLTILDTI